MEYVWTSLGKLIVDGPERRQDASAPFGGAAKRHQAQAIADHICMERLLHLSIRDGVGNARSVAVFLP